MVMMITEKDFRNHLVKYLDQVTDEQQTVQIIRDDQRSVAIIPQGQIEALLEFVKTEEDSFDYAIARDKLIEMQVIPDDPIVESDDRFWDQFKGNN